MKIIILIYLSFFVTCSTYQDKIFYKNNLTVVELNEEIKQNIRQYRSQFTTKSIVCLIFDDKINSKKNTYYIKRISNVSDMYSIYLSYYSVIDGIPLFISSINDGYVNPNDYDSDTINLMIQNLNDDLLMYSIKRDSITKGWNLEYYNDFIIDHSKIWKVKNGEVYKNNSQEYVSKYKNQNLMQINFYRVIDGGVDQR